MFNCWSVPARIGSPDAEPGAAVDEDDPESEDCLFLNIWAPTATQEPLPVMVWIHGGGFFNGAGPQRAARKQR